MKSKSMLDFRDFESSLDICGILVYLLNKNSDAVVRRERFPQDVMACVENEVGAECGTCSIWYHRNPSA